MDVTKTYRRVKQVRVVLEVELLVFSDTNRDPFELVIMPHMPTHPCGAFVGVNEIWFANHGDLLDASDLGVRILERRPGTLVAMFAVLQSPLGQLLF
jgi:hypothetical protein